MRTTYKTGCVLCAQNCGLELEVENNRIVRVRGDKANAKSEGYVCRKGMSIAYHQHNADRLTHPLKRVGDRFERISWDQAVSEVAAKLKGIVGRYGPRAYAYMGGGGQGCHFEAAFGVRVLRGLGSQYHYSALAQEFSGVFWVSGRTVGRQYLHPAIDTAETDLLLAIGWNGMESHQIPQAPRQLRRIAKDPDKLLIVVDPRASETAKIADIHLRIRPGTDALLLKAMIAIILQEGWETRPTWRSTPWASSSCGPCLPISTPARLSQPAGSILTRCGRSHSFLPPASPASVMTSASSWGDTAACPPI